MSEKLFKWKYFCTTEALNVTEWRSESEGAPTQCKNNLGHTVNMDLARVIEVRDPTEVQIQEESVPTGGHFQASSRVMNVTTTPTVQSMDYTLPIDINVVSISFNTSAAHEGDYIEVHIAPDTTIGAITADVAINDTVINVSTSVLSYIKKGYWVTLSDGVNSNDLGRCVSIDTVNSQITVATAATNNFAAVTPTYVQMTVKTIEQFYFGPAAHVRIGDDKTGSSYVPANTVVRLVYHNLTGTAKDLVLVSEYLY